MPIDDEEQSQTIKGGECNASTRRQRVLHSCRSEGRPVEAATVGIHSCSGCVPADNEKQGKMTTSDDRRDPLPALGFCRFRLVRLTP